MSSAKSARHTSPSEARAMLVDATALVCETKCFAFAELASADVLLAVADEENWYHATVSFAGTRRGCLRLALPVQLARELFAAVAGSSASRPARAAEIEQVIGEFAAMVCGTWLAMLGSERSLAMAQPSVHWGGLPAPEDTAIIMAVNARPAVLCADLE